MCDPLNRAGAGVQAEIEWLNEACVRISDEVWNGIAQTAVMRDALYSPEVSEKFKNAYEAHVFELIRTQLRLGLALLVARIWDTHGDRSTFCLPQVARRLDNPDIKRILWRRAAFDRWHPISEADKSIETALRRSRWKDGLHWARRAERYRKEVVNSIANGSKEG
jgi:hypothetical protein